MIALLVRFHIFFIIPMCAAPLLEDLITSQLNWSPEDIQHLLDAIHPTLEIQEFQEFVEDRSNVQDLHDSLDFPSGRDVVLAVTSLLSILYLTSKTIRKIVPLAVSPKKNSRSVSISGIGDVPSIPHNKKQKSIFATLRDPTALAEAMKDLTAAFFSKKTWQSHRSEIRLYMKCCNFAVPPVTPFPLTVESMTLFGSLLKRADYRSAEQYFTAIFREHQLQHFAITPQMEFQRKLIVSACKRGIGAESRKLPITFQHLQDFRKHVWSLKFVIFFLAMVVQWFFLLRMNEVLSIEESHVKFIGINKQGKKIAKWRDSDPPGVRLLICNTKNDIRGKKVARSLYCTCEHGFKPVLFQENNSNPFEPAAPNWNSRLPICPVHALLLLVNIQKALKNQYLCGLPKGKTISASQYASWIQIMIVAIRETVRDAEGVLRFGTHSLRRGGGTGIGLCGMDSRCHQIFWEVALPGG